jgi:hypothetical protein
MRAKGIWYWLAFVISILFLTIAQMFLSAPAVRSQQPAVAEGAPGAVVTLPTPASVEEPDAASPGDRLPRSELSSQVGSRPDAVAAGPSLSASGDVIEVFDNVWAYSTLGMVYDPGRDSVWYAHESQSSSHNPTVYQVDYTSHTVLWSYALSSVNSGWPWQIDNRDGAGYDFVEDTYFLPDYNGDLSYADDNIVEVDVNGVILNAWEMDDEVGSNDSSDGSEIDNVIDIAVVPGSPTRYFVTAAYDGATVYEIELVKTGTWWTPNSWHTIATYSLPVLGDNLGIDWDAEHEVLFHSDWDSTTILITDLSMNPVTAVDATFDCPGAGGYNSGVTYIEGSDPAEVWVTDFSSDETTRCETPFVPVPLTPAWEKWVDDLAWTPGLTVTVETSDTIKVTDVITAVEALVLTELWDPAHINLLDVQVSPPVGTVVESPGSLEVAVPAGPPEVVTIDKWFHVEPCDWTETVLQESLEVDGGPAFDQRSVTINKLAPELHVSSTYDPEVYGGGIISFTLEYGNSGGYENDVWVAATFPISAPFIFSDPLPDELAPGGTSARWDLGDLAQGAAGEIDVYALITETVPASNTIGIWAGIFDHLDVVQDEVGLDFHVNEAPMPVTWEKLLNDVPWEPDISVTLETSQTLVVEELLTPEDGNPSGFTLVETWDPAHLELLSGWVVDPPQYGPYAGSLVPGLWFLEVPPGLYFGPVSISKEFHVQPCNWGETVLWEELQAGTAVRHRPVVVGKLQPNLWIDSFFDVTVYSREEAEFELSYGNAGGFETQAWIRNDFPPEAPFVRSDPSPAEVGPDGSWVVWDLGQLAMGDEGSIDVTVEIVPGLPPSSTIEIWDGIFDHDEVLEDETVISFHVPPPTWQKWVDDVPWTPDLGIAVQMSDTITVVDVISTRSAMAIVEHWNPQHLSLEEYTLDPLLGSVEWDPGFFAWRFPTGAPGTITLTKVFHVDCGAWDYSVLREELWVEGVEWERRLLYVDNTQDICSYLPLTLRRYR